MRHLGGRGRARNRHAVAARHQRDAELPLDLVEMRVALAVEQRQQQIIVEFELAAAAPRLVDDEIAGCGAHCAASAKLPMITPPRLFAFAPAIRTGASLPINSGAPSA